MWFNKSHDETIHYSQGLKRVIQYFPKHTLVCIHEFLRPANHVNHGESVFFPIYPQIQVIY